MPDITRILHAGAPQSKPQIADLTEGNNIVIGLLLRQARTRIIRALTRSTSKEEVSKHRNQF